MYGQNDELKALIERSVALPEMGEWDYEWEEFAGFYDPVTRMFYWAEGSGCSCYGLWDDFNTIGDMSVGRKDEFLNAAASFADGRFSYQFEEVRRAVGDLKL
jgi:hypothetical protein